jgi:hypothetical protein
LEMLQMGEKPTYQELEKKDSAIRASIAAG